MTPAFSITADGEDITGRIADRLVALTVTDEDGITSDMLTLELDDRDNRLAIPPEGAILDLALGFRETGLTRMGRYVVDRRRGAGFPDTMTIEAKAADMAGAIRAPKTRSWRDRTLGQIVATIAGEANLKPVTGDDIAGTSYTLVAQTAESDLHLLTRLARVLDATAKPADGRLVVVRRGTGQTATGERIMPTPILRAQMSGFDWSLGERGKYRSVAAEWSETGAATLHKVVVGSGTPELRLRHPFGTQDEARRAAQAQLDRAARGNTSVDCQLAGFRPGLFAGGLVTFPDLRPELDGDFHLKGVTHELSGSLTTSITSEIAP